MEQCLQSHQRRLHVRKRNALDHSHAINGAQALEQLQKQAGRERGGTNCRQCQESERGGISMANDLMKLD